MSKALVVCARCSTIKTLELPITEDQEIICANSQCRTRLKFYLDLAVGCPKCRHYISLGRTPLRCGHCHLFTDNVPVQAKHPQWDFVGRPPTAPGALTRFFSTTAQAEYEKQKATHDAKYEQNQVWWNELRRATLFLKA